MNSIEQLSEVSLVMGSKKRAVLMFILKDTPMSYTQMSRKFRTLGMKIGSSEIYKHLDVLRKNRYIVKSDKVFLITLKGKTLIESLEKLAGIPDRAPRLEIIF